MTEQASKLVLADIMSRKLITITEDEGLVDIAAKMASKTIGAVVVVGKKGEVVGILTERDLAFKVVAKGRSPQDLTVAAVMTHDPKCLSSQTPIAEAFELTQTGKFRHVPIVDNGQLVGIVSARDINRAFHDERELVNEMKAKFIAITSHELRTPYTIIKGYMEMLNEGLWGEFNEQQKSVIAKIVGNITRVEKILSGLERFYLNATQHFQARFEPVAIDKLIEETVHDVQFFLEKRKQKLHLEVEAGIPPVNIVKNEVRQVVFNILINAIRFTQDGGSITIRAKDQKDSICVSIEDNGIGIPQEKMAAIFESFYEVQDALSHSSGTIEFKSGGMGLGLAIAKKIIESYEGEIWAESKEREYSRFFFTLPKSKKKGKV